ncbi:Protein Dr1 [Chionoecetes opilio]|uniref:Protein Dr1 n=1 Tax=Chionoecetes opilio TaxID=41210 RepID=A0A8J4Y763_CHIOP|nr:Protein Dr1 [Chionoecetes opilio]
MRAECKSRRTGRPTCSVGSPIAAYAEAGVQYIRGLFEATRRLQVCYRGGGMTPAPPIGGRRPPLTKTPMSVVPDPVQDDELTIPRASMNKMIKELLPNVRVANEARELILNCCTEFIHLVSSEANEICNQQQKKTINAEHILACVRESRCGLMEYYNTREALDKLGFGDYRADAEAVLKDCKAMAAKKRRKSTRLENLGIPEEELLRQQQELFAKGICDCTTQISIPLYLLYDNAARHGTVPSFTSHQDQDPSRRHNFIRFKAESHHTIMPSPPGPNPILREARLKSISTAKSAHRDIASTEKQSFGEKISHFRNERLGSPTTKTISRPDETNKRRLSLKCKNKVLKTSGRT